MFSSFLRKIQDKIETKIQNRLTKKWKAELEYDPPAWFVVYTLIHFKSISILKMKERKRIEYCKRADRSRLSKEQIDILDRVVDMDYTMPLPPKLYNFYYRTDKRISNSYLIIFYNYLADSLSVGGNLLAAYRDIIFSPNIKTYTKKIIATWIPRIERSDITQVGILKENKKLFGETEVQMLVQVADLGKEIYVLKNIVKDLESKKEIDRAKSNMIISMKWNNFLIAVTYIFTIVYSLPTMIDAMPNAKLPKDIGFFYDMGIYLRTPKGIIVGTLTFLFLKLTIKIINRDGLITNFSIFLPGVGKFILFTELYNFINTLCMIYEYVDAGDDIKVERAISTLSNRYIKNFFEEKLSEVRSTSDMTLFFKNNNVFGIYSELMASEGQLYDKLKKLQVLIEQEKKAMMEKLPEMMKSFSMYTFAFALLLLTLLMIRIDIFTTMPSNFIE